MQTQTDAPLPDLASEWLDALGLLQDICNVRELARVFPQLSNTHYLMWRIGKHGVWLADAWSTLYPVERREVLLGLALRLDDDSDEDTVYTAQRIGVCSLPILAPSERWCTISRASLWQDSRALLPGGFPQLCAVCCGPVCSDALLPKRHDGCTNYLNLVLKPALANFRAQQAAALAAASSSLPASNAD